MKIYMVGFNSTGLIFSYTEKRIKLTLDMSKPNQWTHSQLAWNGKTIRILKHCEKLVLAHEATPHLKLWSYSCQFFYLCGKFL